jgi:gluconolactonase
VTKFIEVASGLRFPEGPISMPDGSVLVAEMFGQRLMRVHSDGTAESVATIRGGPNGAAIGPDGAVYICNNGGCYTETTVDGLCVPDLLGLEQYIGGRIQRLDLDSRTVEDLYTSCDGEPLRAPNDIVFDGVGGFYFTDSGLNEERIARHGGIYYALADGSQIREVVFPVTHPNGIGLSPDGATLYWAETWNGRIMQRAVLAPGVLAPAALLDESACLFGFPGYQLLDSLGVDSAGNVCVATAPVGGISVVSPDGQTVEFIPTGDMITTNICFGGADLKTAYVTLSASGRLVSMTWPRPGAQLAHMATLTA